MFTIRCTAKVLKRTGFSVESQVPEPTTVLGNWYAHILFFHRRQVLLFVSERSRLAVVTPAKETRRLASHLTQHLSALLARLGAQPAWIDAETGQMVDVRYAATNSRSMLGTITDYKYLIESVLYDSPEISEIEIALFLSDVPVGPLQHRIPAEVTLELFANSRFQVDK